MNQLIKDIELLIGEIDPATNLKFSTDTILSNKYNNQVLRDAHSLIEEYIKLYELNRGFYKRRKFSFYIDKRKREKIPISEKSIPISAFAHTLNEFIDANRVKKVKGSEITSWLMNKGYLEEFEHEDGKIFKVLTDKSSMIGMQKKVKTNSYGRTYDVNLYSEAAQKFIIKNLDEISDYIKDYL